MVSRVALLVECHAHAEHVRQSSDRRNGPRSSTRPESACNPTSDSPSPFERSEFGGVPADHNGSDESLCKSILRMTSSRCQRRIVSGVTTVDTCLSKRRPSRCPSSLRRRRSSSSKRKRRPPSLDFRTRFSSRRNAIRSVCSRWSHAHTATTTN